MLQSETVRYVLFKQGLKSDLMDPNRFVSTPPAKMVATNKCIEGILAVKRLYDEFQPDVYVYINKVD